MPLYHVVLFKLKPSVTAEQSAELTKKAYAMVTKIPGLSKISVGPPLPATVHRSKEFNLGIVAILEKPEDLAGYATHPAHMEVQDYRQDLCEDTLVYDLVFDS
ncbi:hypothetical protein M426DRAFT_320341 [Hypoxylon sp. CI-4A]|nr:hypothetical protein M426DRAFT_320341 [Hypoxylon sp. CI-4A]